jgi:hypothetical protein
MCACAHLYERLCVGVRKAGQDYFLCLLTLLLLFILSVALLIRHDAVFRRVGASPDSRWVKCVCAERERKKERERERARARLSVYVRVPVCRVFGVCACVNGRLCVCWCESELSIIAVCW